MFPSFPSSFLSFSLFLSFSSFLSFSYHVRFGFCLYISVYTWNVIILNLVKCCTGVLSSASSYRTLRTSSSSLNECCERLSCERTLRMSFPVCIGVVTAVDVFLALSMYSSFHSHHLLMIFFFPFNTIVAGPRSPWWVTRCGLLSMGHSALDRLALDLKVSTVWFLPACFGCSFLLLLACSSYAWHVWHFPCMCTACDWHVYCMCCMFLACS